MRQKNIIPFFLSQDDSGGGVLYKNKLYGVIPFVGSDCAESVELINVCAYKIRVKREDLKHKLKEKLLHFISKLKKA